MDNELREAQRDAQANPRDPTARARLCIAERRRGHGIGRDVQPQVLEEVLTSPWVSTHEWAAVRTRFREITIVRPGRLVEVEGFREWMSIKVWTNPFHVVGRIPGRPPGPGSNVAKYMHAVHAIDALLIFLEGLGICVGQECPTTRRVEQEPAYRIPVNDGRHITIQPEPEVIVTERTKETWSLEHVRAHCGLDPVCQEPGSAKLVPPVRVGRCFQCDAMDGRERASGAILCYDCQKEGWK